MTEPSKIQPIHLIVTHSRPHLDEIVAIWLAIGVLGDEVFPGISSAEVRYVDAGSNTPEGSPADEWFADGVLCIGVGHGRYDEHPGDGQERKEKKCAALLLAEDHGLDTDPRLQELLTYVTENDTQGSRNPFELGRLVNTMHCASDPETVLGWVFDYLNVELQRQTRFFSETAKEFEKCARIESWPCSEGTIKVAIIESDNDQIGGYARSEYGGKCRLVIQRRTNGHTYVGLGKGTRESSPDVAKMLRVFEMRRRGIAYGASFRELGGEAKIDRDDCWHHQQATGTVMNGSLTAPNADPTRLSLAEVEAIVKIAINPKQFAPQYSADCQRGKCAGEVCPWYAFGLQRCHLIQLRSNRRQ